MNIHQGWVVLAAISVIEPMSSRAVRADAAVAIAEWGIAGAASGPSRRHAAELAVEECRRQGGTNCRPFASVEQGCIAIAVSAVSVRLPHTGLATSWSQDAARREARRKCSQEDGGYGCRTDASACDQHVANARPANDVVRAEPPVKGATEAMDARTQAALHECQQKAVPREGGEYACSDAVARKLFIAMSYEKIEPTISTTTAGMLLKRASPSGNVTCWFAIEQYTEKEHLAVDQYECRIKHKLND